MRFLGVDFGWQGRPTGLAALYWSAGQLELVATERLVAIEEILGWIDRAAGPGDAMVAVDAPTVIVNPAGMRAADRLMHRLFGRFHAGAYPANLGRPWADRTVELGRALERRGFAHAAEIAAGKSGRYQIEVHPHAACVSLFGLDRIIKYKKGRLEQRRAGLLRYRRLLRERLPRLEPALGLARSRLLDAPLPRSGAELKGAEDRLDAILSAYVGAHWWYWGARRNLSCGSGAEGYVIVPQPPVDSTASVGRSPQLPERVASEPRLTQISARLHR